MEDTEEEVLEVVISWDHTRNILEISGKFLELDYVIGFYVVPAPNELIKHLFLGLF